MSIRSEDEKEKVKIMRSIPSWAAIGVLGAFVGQAMIFYAGFTKWADATQQNTVELKALTVAINMMQVGNASRDARLAELERRVGILEIRQ